MEAKHTQGKLERNSIKGWELWIGADYHIADVHGNIDSRRANALHIVNCWNSHDALLVNLRKANKELTRCRRTEGYAQKQNGLLATLQKKIEAAISLAEKGIQ